jgi:hypothetical protein
MTCHKAGLRPTYDRPSRGTVSYVGALGCRYDPTRPYECPTSRESRSPISEDNLTVRQADDGSYTVVRVIATGFPTEAAAWAWIDAHDPEHAKVAG